MKLYDCTTAPSPRRTRIFIAEKGLEFETIQVDLASGEQFDEAFRALNPRCTVPVLQLDDGTTLSDNCAIATWLEATYPQPPLLGQSTLEKALITSWNERAMLEGFVPAADAFRNHARGLEGRALTGPRNFAQIPELVERGRTRVADFFDVLNDGLAQSRYVASDRYSMADITVLCLVDFAAWIKLVPGDRHHLQRWYDEVSARPSASA